MSMLYKLESIVRDEEDDNNVTFRLYGTNIPIKETLSNTDDNTTTVVIGHKSPDSININKNTTNVIDNKDEKSASSSSTSTSIAIKSSSINCNDQNYEVNFDTTVSASVVLSKKRSISSSKITDADHAQANYCKLLFFKKKKPGCLFTFSILDINQFVFQILFFKFQNILILDCFIIPFDFLNIAFSFLFF